MMKVHWMESLRDKYEMGGFELSGAGQNYGLPKTDVPPSDRLGAAKRHSREGVFVWLFSYTGKVESLWKWNF